MQITEDTNHGRYQILAYKLGKITINDKTYTRSLIITTQTLIDDWGPKTVEDITQAHIDRILTLEPEIILLGTGEHFKIPPTELRQFDSMDTGAACRTFIALSSEGRNVAAALLIEHGNPD